MGKSAPTPAVSPYTQQLAKESKTLFNESQPLQQQLLSQYSGLVNGNYNPQTLPGYQPAYSLAKQGLAGSYGQAQNQIIENSPTGGALSGNLANLATSNAASQGSLPAQISSGLISQLQNNALGLATGTTNSAMGGMSNAGGQAQSASNLGAQLGEQQNLANMQAMGSLGSGLGMLGMMSMGGCCFIFVEANRGFLDPVVRRYRDEKMTPRNRRGYYRLAERLVPLMRRARIARALVEWLMVNPMIFYGRWYFGRSKTGFIFWPVAKAWMGVFNLLGFGKFVRTNGEVI